ncbi:hypothetical protein [Nocardia sp. NPDC002869]|uniref:hypothetical protein n=1 Tax=Nocardia sp. NPDC002869 TaxID=3161032 RepID=UPI00398D029D
MLDILSALLQVSIQCAKDDQVSVNTVRTAVTERMSSSVQEAENWLHNGPLAAGEMEYRVELLKSNIEAIEKLASDKIEAEKALPQHGAMLGYSDENVEANVIWTQICAFEDEEHQRYSTAYERLKRRVDRDLLMYVFDELDVFMRIVTDALTDVKEGRFKWGYPDAVDEFVRRIRSGAVTLTSAFHVHQTQTYWLIQDKFGKDSEEYKRASKIFHDLYDSCFGYKWLLQLRHVMLHISIEAAAVVIKASVHHDPIIEINMDRGWMKESSGVMSKRYNREPLLAMTSNPSIINMAKEAMPALAEVQEQLDDILHPETAEDAAVVRELIGRFDGRTGLYALQTGLGFTRRVPIPPHRLLSAKVLNFAERYRSSDS